MNTNLDCTIILLSFNSLNVTDECLTRLEKAIAYNKEILLNNVKVIVVDNGSHDGSAEMIRKKHPGMHLVALEKNIGYAAGNNLAMKMVSTPYILLMNSDTYIEKDSLVKTLRRMQTADNCDVLVSRWTPEDGVFYSYGGYLPTPLRIIFWSFGFETIPVLKYFLHRIYSYNPEFYKHEGRMEWCPPCFMLLKRKVYDLTGGFDEKLWFHMVDVEWCFRMRKNDLTICYTPSIQVLHIGGASSKGLKSNLIADNFKGLLHFCKTHYPQSLRQVSFFLKIGLLLRSYLYYLFGNKDLAITYKNISREIIIS